MRRLAICVALAALLLVPAEALGATRTYKGTGDADPNAAFTIKVKKVEGKRYVTLARAENLRIDCSDGDYVLGRAEIKGRVRVRQGKFSTDATSSDGLREVAVSGKIVRRTMKGTFRYAGSTRIEDDEADTADTQDCDSGRVPYTVKR